MSLPVHLQVDLAEYERGTQTEDETVQFFADVLIAGAVLALPPDVMQAVAERLMDGTLSEQGDVLRWPSEDPGHEPFSTGK